VSFLGPHDTCLGSTECLPWSFACRHGLSGQVQGSQMGPPHLRGVEVMFATPSGCFQVTQHPAKPPKTTALPPAGTWGSQGRLAAPALTSWDCRTLTVSPTCSTYSN
jgi:hypothetical protein